MNRYILDTHTLLWTLFEPSKLSPHARRVIKDTRNSIEVSSISFWEISIKFALGKLDLPGTQPDELPAATTGIGFEIVDPSAELMARFHRLPTDFKHRDPFDRLLIWTAIHRQRGLISKDRRMADYHSLGLEQIW